MGMILIPKSKGVTCKLMIDMKTWFKFKCLDVGQELASI